MLRYFDLLPESGYNSNVRVDFSVDFSVDFFEANGDFQKAQRYFVTQLLHIVLLPLVTARMPNLPKVM